MCRVKGIRSLQPKQFHDVLVSDKDWGTYKFPCGHGIIFDMPDNPMNWSVFSWKPLEVANYRLPYTQKTCEQHRLPA